MPFQARRIADDALVIPEEVANGVDLKCTACGVRMRTREPSQDGRARHFFHSEDTDCSGRVRHPPEAGGLPNEPTAPHQNRRDGEKTPDRVKNESPVDYIGRKLDSRMIGRYYDNTDSRRV
jgi:hypothetical protein